MNQRFDELDSLRGLAALAVFFFHMYLVFNENLISRLLFEYGPLRIAVAGSEAVTFFFVLSGFVLSLPFHSRNQPAYRKFVIRRVCRIYIPYLTAILFALSMREIFYTGKIIGLSDWFNVNWTAPFHFHAAMDHLLLIGTFSSNLNNVVWSLVHEMRISLIFPFLMSLLVRMNVMQGIGLGIALSVGSVLYVSLSGADFWGTEWYASLHYTAMFIVGALLAKHRDHLQSMLRNMRATAKRFLFLFGLLLYVYANPSFILNMVIEGFNPYYRTVMDTWFTSLGAAILMMFGIGSVRFSNFLKSKFIHYMGKISYSLYLSHLAVLLSCIHFLYNVLPMWAICLIAAAGTFAVSSLMYHLVEKPSIKLGRALTGQSRKPEINQRASVS
jgi:Predicted acyltransferases